MSHSAQKQKKDSNFITGTQILSKIRNSDFSSISKLNNIKDISHELPIMTTPLDFIKNKKKFIIQDSFDIRGAKNFLKAKEEAMMEIKLDDEILEEIQVENKNKYNKNTSFVKSKNDTKKFRRAKKKNKYYKSCITEKKSKYGKSKYSHFAKNIDENKNNEKNTNVVENIFINNKIDDDSKGSDYLYKFILDNANETEDNFQKKFDKIVKDAQNKQNNKNSKNSNYHSTLYENQENLRKYNSAKVKRKKTSIFNFSEKAKKLMKKEGLKESSILSGSDNNKKLSKNNSFDSIKESKKDYKAFLGKKFKSIINNKKRDSIFSILDILG